MTDVGKKHAKETTTSWTEALRDPDPSGGLVAFIGDILQGYATGTLDLDEVLHKEVVRRCTALKLDGLQVWSAITALALLLPRKITPEAGDNLKGKDR